jgi:hypothetical protein
MRLATALVTSRDVPRRVFLGRLAIVVAGSCVAAFARAAPTGLAKAEWTAIRKVISQQLAALRAGDDERAFGYASPGIQAQFGDARRFMAMVRDRYSALLDARYTEFLEGAVIDGLIVQPLRLIAPDNGVQVALYTMEKQQRGWRINGCQLAPSTVRAA